jgi:hypothetical protein
MRAAVIFLVTWITAAVLVFIFVDHNTYVVSPEGNMKLKDRATAGEKVVVSFVMGGVYSLVNVLCVCGTHTTLSRLRAKREDGKGARKAELRRGVGYGESLWR